MRKKRYSCKNVIKKNNKEFNLNSIFKPSMIKLAVFLLVITAAMVYMPQGLLAAPFLGLTTPEESQTILQTEQKSQNTVDDTEQNNTANSSGTLTEQASETEGEETAAIEGKADNLTKEKEETYVEGRDLRNDPDYIAELKKIYSEEDIARLNAPRKWVVMPNVVGMTEADALNKLHSLGIVAYVAYEANQTETEEGTCFVQDIPAGMNWNTDASILIRVQKKEGNQKEPSSEDNVVTTASPDEAAASVESTVTSGSAVQDKSLSEPEESSVNLEATISSGSAE